MKAVTIEVIDVLGADRKTWFVKLDKPSPEYLAMLALLEEGDEA